MPSLSARRTGARPPPAGPAARLRPRLVRGEVAPQHGAHEVEARKLRGLALGHQPAVAQDRDPVGDRVDLLQEVGHEHDADALLGEPAHHAEQHRHLVGVEARGRLVEDQHPGREVHRPGDRHEVLHRHREAPERRPDIDRQAERRQAFRRAVPHRPAADEAESGRLAAEEQVLRHGEVRQQADLLVDRGDAGPGGVLRRARRDRHAVEPDLAGIAPDDPGHGLDEGRLAGAVLAQQSVDLPRRRVKSTPREGLVPGKALGEPADAEKGRVGHGTARRDHGAGRVSNRGPSCSRRPSAGRRPPCRASTRSGSTSAGRCPSPCRP